MAVTTVPGRYIQHTAAADVSTGRLAIRKIIWHGVTDASHTLQIKDGTGDIIIPTLAAGATGKHVFDFDANPIYLDGVETDVMDSGTALYLLI
jgi:hypothetical protein